MAKKIIGHIKLQIPAGKATPAPPVGPALGTARRQHHGFLQGVQRQDVGQGSGRPDHSSCRHDLCRPVVSFITKTPPASILLKRAAGIAKGSGEPNKNKVGTVTEKQVEDIAKLKLPDLNAPDSRPRFRPLKARPAAWGSRSSVKELEMGRVGKRFKKAKSLVEVKPYKLEDAMR